MLVFCVGFRLGTAPTQKQSILGVPFSAIYKYVINIIQLLLRGGGGGRTQGSGFRI